jgi:hypothetical protein
MMIIEAPRTLAELLDYTAEALDIAPELDARLTASYRDLGEWFKRDNETRFFANSEVYPQGSKRLGTLTAPANARDDCDVDLVYRRDVKRTSVTQAELKESAGEQLSRYLLDRSRRGLEVPRLTEGSRCWCLRYDGYHLDVLPALPDDTVPSPADAIIITDRDLHEWQSSNPKAYSRWFRKRMEVALVEKRDALAKSAGVDVEEILEETVKTPLQRAVQLLKRHRDVTYEGHPDDKPTSIIITTLAAQAYGNETDIYAALLSIVDGMHEHIRQKDGKLWVLNPTNPEENFADRWVQYPQRAELFVSWLGAVRGDLTGALSENGLEKVGKVLGRGFGQDAANRALQRYATTKRVQRESGTLRASRGVATLGTGASGIVVPRHTFFGDGK